MDMQRVARPPHDNDDGRRLKQDAPAATLRVACKIKVTHLMM
jgi:hypothetical protein